MPLQVIGWENIELISDRPLETMLDEFKRLKAEYPGRQAHLCYELHRALQCYPDGIPDHRKHSNGGVSWPMI